jgi:hypothetical protein
VAEFLSTYQERAKLPSPPSPPGLPPSCFRRPRLARHAVNLAGERDVIHQLRLDGVVDADGYEVDSYVP